jgi:hypothetical protein
LRATTCTSRCQRHIAEASPINLRGRRAFHSEALPAIAHDIIISPGVVIERFIRVVVIGLSLATSSAEIALLGLTATTYTRRIIRIIDRAEVASNFSATTRDAGLIDALVLGLAWVAGCRRR